MRRFFQGALAAIVLLTLGACGKDEGYTTFTVPAGLLRTMNAMPDSPPLNVYVNESLRQQQSFGASSQFFQVLPELSLTLAADYFLNQQLVSVFANESLFVGVNHELTAIFAGTLDNPVLIRLENPPRSEADATVIELQFVNAASGLNNVTVTLLQGATVAAQHSLDFAEFTPLGTVAPGDYVIQVTDTGTGNVLWDSGAFSLTAGTRGMLALVDYFGPGGSGVRMLSLNEAGATNFANEQLPAAMRVANMTSDQGPLDVYLDGTLIADTLSFGSLNDFAIIPVPALNLVVTPAGVPQTVLSETANPGAAAGSFQTVTVTGLGATHVAQLHINDTRATRFRVRLTAVNAAVGRGNFDVYITDPGTDLTTVGPRIAGLTAIPSATSSQALTLEAGSYDLSITTSGTRDVLVGPLRIDMADEGTYSFFVTNPNGGGDGPLEILLADDFN